MDSAPPELPGLGNLAQAARTKRLKQARGILLFVGILTIIGNIVFLALARSQVKDALDKEEQKLRGQGMVVDQAKRQQVEDQQILLIYAIHGVAIALGVLFVVFALIIYRFPVFATVTSLVLYIGAAVVFGLLHPPSLAAGLIIKIIIVIALVKAVQAALAFERERAEAAAEPMV